MIYSKLNLSFLKLLISVFIVSILAGCSIAMNGLGLLYADGGGVLAKDETKAAKWFREAAEEGNGYGMVNLGYMYQNGKGGLAKDETKAAEWYRKAVEAGNDSGMVGLGSMYLKGKGGLAKDETKAAEWYRKAVEAGNDSGMILLGSMYENGMGGLAKDETKAVEWYRKAVEAGNDLGMVALGSMYLKGKGGLAKDETKAVEWYRKAAEIGSSNGMVNLGDMYASGTGGLAKDLNQASSYYLKAYKQYLAISDIYGAERAKNNLDAAISSDLVTDTKLLQEVHSLFKPAPKLEWLNQPRSSPNEETALSVKATEIKDGIGSSQLFVDGELVESKTRDFLVEATVPIESHEITIPFKVKLPPGKHDIKVRVCAPDTNINCNELSVTIVSVYAKTIKPRLFALVLGIDEYAWDKYNLPNADNDAEAIANTLKGQTGTLYANTEVRYLHSKTQTSRANIIAALKALGGEGANKPEFNDVFIFYAAGHATAYGSSYYLSSSDIQLTGEDHIKEASISQAELSALLAAIPTNKKLVILDTCHAGDSLVADNILYRNRGLMDEQNMVDRLNKSAGAAILMASRSDQQASENYHDHGLFTYVLLQGFKGEAADTRGYVSTDGLKKYAEDNVNRISEKEFKHSQNPYASIVGDDFPVSYTDSKCRNNCALY